MKAEEYHPHLRRVLNLLAGLVLAAVSYVAIALWLIGHPYRNLGELLVPQDRAEWIRLLQGAWVAAAVMQIGQFLAHCLRRFNKKLI
jgi:hypothetical protein